VLDVLFAIFYQEKIKKISAAFFTSSFFGLQNPNPHSDSLEMRRTNRK